MAKVVAKRKLRKSYYNNKENKINNDIFEINETNINGLYKRNGANQYTKHKNKKIERNELNNGNNIKKRLEFVFSMQCITMIAIMAFVFGVKYLNIEIVKNSEISKKIISQFNKNYTIEEIFSGVEDIWDKTYLFLDPIIPDKLSEKSIAVFNSMFNNEKGDVNIYKENINIYQESKEVINSQTENKDTVVAVSSSISTQDEYIKAINESGITFVKPTTGVITSSFGAREVIFEGVNPYHYGTDIANNKGTSIYSSIDGKVTVCSYTDQTGYYIEVENGNVCTRYSHLSKQLVKVGDVVKQGQEIGKMGDTGLATGPHLHFEIMYNRNRVDAEKILKLD